MSKWFRWYEGTCEDGKFRVTARNAGVTVATVMGIWAIILEDASNDAHRGLAMRGCDFYSAILDVPEAEMQRVLQCMEDVGLLSAGSEYLTITKWKERQFETDAADGTNAIRQRKFRERQAALRNAAVTARNGAVTEAVTGEYDIEVENNNKINGHVTPLRNGSVTAAKRPDTDTDTDTEKKEHCPVAKATRTKLAYSEDFEKNFWMPYPRSETMSKKEAWREWVKLAPDQRLAACRAIEPYRHHLRRHPTLQTVHACRFLSEDRAEGILEIAAERPNRIEGIL